MGRSRTPRGGAQASYHAPHVPRRRRRRVLAHPVRMLPHVAGAAAVAALATPATAVAWVAGLATGRIPRPVERLVTHAHEHFAAVNGTLYLLTDERPPAPCRSAFGTSYHARSAAYLALISDATPRLRERSPADGRPRAPGSGGA